MTPTTARGGSRPTPPATAARRWRLLVAYLVTITLVGYLVVGIYALSVVGFTVAFGLLLAAGVAVIDRRIDRRLKRHITTARDVPYLPVEAALRRHPASRARRYDVPGSGVIATHTDRPGRVPSASSATPMLPRLTLLRATRGERRPSLRATPPPRFRTQPRVARSGGHLLSTTAYCATGNPTASGAWPELGMAAGNMWPLGTRLHIDGYGDVTVTDRIGWGSDLDIFFGSDAGCEARALNYGRQARRVEVIA